MQLTLWTYEGPPHIGAMRIAASMRGVHYVLHAPQGDTYADLLFTMIERNDKRPPVSYTTFQARNLGGDTAELVKQSLHATYERFQPEVMLVGESCTAELIQDQPGALAQGMGFPVPIVPLELPAYSRKENWGASETFYHLVRALLTPQSPEPGVPQPGAPQPGAPQPEVAKAQKPTSIKPKANLLGPTSLGFRCRDDVKEICNLLNDIGVDVHVIAPLNASPEAIRQIPEADFNLCLYPEVAQTTCAWLERMFQQPYVKTVPIGLGAIRDFLDEIAALTELDVSVRQNPAHSRLSWYSRSVDSTYLTGKRVFIFGDATHAVAAARIASEELGFKVVGLGTYSREFARDIRAAAKIYGVEALISDDYLDVERKVAELEPELVLGTQMERHIAKRLGIPCAVISAPVHVQDFPARYAPQMGFEGANVIFDTWVHPLMMGLEEHLLTMFRDDFEFHDQTAPSHLGPSHMDKSGVSMAGTHIAATTDNGHPDWNPDAEKELQKIPFFVRGKARRNTERFAQERGLARITIETLYDAKAHFSR